MENKRSVLVHTTDSFFSFNVGRWNFTTCIRVSDEKTLMLWVTLMQHVSSEINWNHIHNLCHYVFFFCYFSRTLTSTWRRSIKHELFLPRGINTNYTESKANISQLWGQPWDTDTMSSHHEWRVEKQVSESSLRSITSLNETSWLLQQTAQIMRVILMPLTTIYHAVLNVFLICFH